jgi:hypothetical protein
MLLKRRGRSRKGDELFVEGKGREGKRREDDKQQGSRWRIKKRIWKGLNKRWKGSSK